MRNTKLAAGAAPRRSWRVLLLAAALAAAAATTGAMLGDSSSTLSSQGRTSHAGGPVRDPAALLRHRVRVLNRLVDPGATYLGATSPRRIQQTRRYSWTSGFLPGALWQAGFGHAALRRTIANLGGERSPSFDVGFIYETSSLLGYRKACPQLGARICLRLRRSALAAADHLVELARGNSGAGTIPTRPVRGPTSDTIIDGMMNLPILYWAGRATGDPSYRRVARRHAHRVERLLVRPNGSTAQTVRLDRRGKVVERPFRQGLSPKSTWARGQAWAVYGFTTSAQALEDGELAATAERLALWTKAHLPASGVPPWDYDAKRPTWPDTSAGVITAAGLFRLDALCRRRAWYCRHADLWRPLGDRMLSASLEHVRKSGMFDGQVNGRGATPQEHSYGLYYALEALNLKAR